MAPGAHLVNVKVGAADGAVDVTQVIAAVDWVVKHRNDPGLNIRVLNLSYGTDGVQAYRSDPLAHAVELAWRKGIVVVSGGNQGTSHPQLLNPALNPHVLAVGAADLGDTYGVADDTVPSWSSVGAAARRVDLVAPGKSIVSLRSPGSRTDEAYPGARIGTRFFRGSGTSQAAAVVSGAAALLLQDRPSLTPDQVKRLLVTSASPLPLADPLGRGAGLVSVNRALALPTPAWKSPHANGSGKGWLDASRGTQHLVSGGVALRGEVDVFGRPWNSITWARAAAAETSWNGGAWVGTRYAGDGWGGTSFADRTWHKAAWRDSSWSKAAWRNEVWSKAAWRADGWSKAAWR